MIFVGMILGDENYTGYIFRRLVTHEVHPDENHTDENHTNGKHTNENHTDGKKPGMILVDIFFVGLIFVIEGPV